MLILFSFCSVFMFAQQKIKKHKIPKDSLDKRLWEQEYEKTKNENVAGGNPFYKNIDSAKASKYKMLNKMPAQQYSELKQSRISPQQYKIEKPNDSILYKKKKK